MSHFLVREPGQTRVHASHIKGSPVWLCDTPIESGKVLAVDDEHLTCPGCWAALESYWTEQLERPDACDLVFCFYTYDGVLHQLSNVERYSDDRGNPFVRGWVRTDDGKTYGIGYPLKRVLGFFIDGQAWVHEPPIITPLD